MDLVRSCYIRRMRYLRSDPGVFFNALWYRAAPSALPFPTNHRFGSGNWDTARKTPTVLGDDATLAQKWYSGKRVNRSDGKSFAGALEYFQKGAALVADLERGFDGTPLQCLQRPLGITKGGIALPVTPARANLRKGGKNVSSIPVGVPCLLCAPGITPATVTANLAGFIGPNAPFNGVHVVPQISSCIWQLFIDPMHVITVIRNLANQWHLMLQNGFLAGNWFGSTAPGDCLSDTTVTVVPPNLVGGNPTQLLTVP